MRILVVEDEKKVAKALRDFARAHPSLVVKGGMTGDGVLTAAELRLLPLLSTHLSFPEIARELFLSPNTIKSQAYSIYRKLGVSSRNEAVQKATTIGLLGA